MSKGENTGHRYYSGFDNVSTETLEKFLEADFNASEDERSDVDTIIYINKLLGERETADEKASAEDIAAAKKEFYEKYYPCDDENFLFDFEYTGIVWKNAKIECSVSGKFTQEEAKKIIDSIYK
jgi:hypothetical protein